MNTIIFITFGYFDSKCIKYCNKKLYVNTDNDYLKFDSKSVMKEVN